MSNAHDVTGGGLDILSTMVEEPHWFVEQLVQEASHFAQMDGPILRDRALMEEAVEHAPALPPCIRVPHQSKLIDEAGPRIPPMSAGRMVVEDAHSQFCHDKTRSIRCVRRASLQDRDRRVV